MARTKRTMTRKQLDLQNVLDNPEKLWLRMACVAPTQEILEEYEEAKSQGKQQLLQLVHSKPLHKNNHLQWTGNGQCIEQYKWWTEQLETVLQGMVKIEFMNGEDAEGTFEVVKMCSDEEFNDLKLDYDFLLKYGPRSRFLPKNPLYTGP